ncbi:acyl-CoA dehydrogenase family protein [Mycolicibacillus parakoreensis]|uniref:Acyl-CoA dehydrogenase family protein n=1 Tax=Mycolicibacillus parakoreensis TaxID=1069221 RepID=A0ABY3U239_9MYCO|nr:acyl-CoA dehydrogenase family protein [Mycolicibacillus parakoreensis]MCV7315079.1 acyl-CoA dehydrogenase family protein [Mycolicibacillus parakoreensis]ULN53567.1 acyl-CoA dehydrogenase family protein [Mycolicibacillus parakoreensis]
MSRLFPDYRPSWETDQHRELRKHAGAFFGKEATPNQERWVEQHGVDREFWTKAGAAGLLGLDLPEEFGGAGGDYALNAVVQEELVYAHDQCFGFSVHSPIVAHYLYAYGTDEQRKRWLPKVISGEAVLAIAMTEPGTGSDLQSVRTTAVRDGEQYVINGSKTFISNGTHCDLVVIVAKTDPSQGAGGVSLIVAETDGLTGFERGRVLAKMGQHGQDTRELFFADMRVPVANLLGEREGLGFYQLMEQLARERLIIGSLCAALAEAAVLEAIDYSRQREAFGHPIGNFQNTKFVLAECKTEALAIKTMVDYAIQQYVDGHNDPMTASMAKLFAAEKCDQVVDKCLQIFGGYGYMTEYPIANMYTGSRVNRIYGGTSEIMKEIISRSL